ncbi:MAG: peptidase D-alanyl-D-alanine carboxypeptidase 1 [Frankiales bacterium]|nr:peptidase D-alanyl-D-alanine carboxypeptidase 1 [Frankiales bacterium]
MRTPRRLALAAAALALPVIGGAPAHADSPATVGGEQLATRGVVTASGAPALPVTTAAGWVVADLDTGAVLAAKDPHGLYAPASTLKTLTALTLIPKLDSHQLVQPTFDDVNVEGSKVGLVDTVRYPVNELFTSMLVVSGNDAALALATANGGLTKTVDEMNAEAARLQADDTHAVNDNGLDAHGQHSSAYDLALIARAGMQLPDFRAYVATKHAHIRGAHRNAPIAISSHDKLLYNYPGAIGIKNGFTVAARATFVGAATRGGHTLVVTLMKTAPRYWPEAAALLDWGFKATAADAAPVGQLVEPLSAEGPAPTASPGAAPQQVAKVAAASPAGGGLPLLPATVVAAGLAVMATGLLRNRRRNRGKLRLPPI